MALTRKGSPFVWTDRQQAAFEALKACLVCAPILGFPTESGSFVLDTDTSLFAVGGVLSHLQNDREVVIACASCSLRLSQRRYCTTRREILAVVMCTHFRSYLRGGGGHSLQITAPSGGSSDSGMGTACTLVFAIRTILSYIRVPPRCTARERGWDVAPMWPVSAA